MQQSNPTQNTVWQAGRFRLNLSRPLVMGIVNATPDSFSDGGQYAYSIQAALNHAEQLVKHGAHILDIGGESTRPGAAAAAVSVEEEWKRVEPLLRETVSWGVPVSLDTRRSEIMRRALENGLADIINDVQALSDHGAVETLAAAPDIGICLMHMQGLPENMQDNPQYTDVVGEVARYLNERTTVCTSAGISRERLILDPGFCFGKTLEHNILLMRHLPDLIEACGLPMLVGVSRKSMIGALTGESVPSERVHGSVAAALFAAQHGAGVIRVHDVKATVDALKVWHALNAA